jgi:hypothetical protein
MVEASPRNSPYFNSQWRGGTANGAMILARIFRMDDGAKAERINERQ